MPSEWDNRLAAGLAERLVRPARENWGVDAFAKIEFGRDDLDIYLGDVELDAETFTQQCSIFRAFHGDMPCIETREGAPIPVQINLPGGRFMEIAYRFGAPILGAVFERLQDLVWNETGQLTRYSVNEGIDFFQHRLTEFLAVRFSARESNISHKPGLPFTVTTNSSRLRVSYVPIYLVNAPNFTRVLNFPTWPVTSGGPPEVTGWIQPATYYFGAAPPGQTPKFDFSASYRVPPDSTAHLAI
jgi:hypothetical protein